MSAPLQRLNRSKLPTHPSASANPEQRFWHSFKSPLLINDYASITSIHFSPVSPHDFAITSSTRVQIFSSKTRKVSKTISRFKETAYSGTIRSDGRLLVAGDYSGLVQVFDLNSRAILRTWDQHKQPVQVAKWCPNSVTCVLTASDDSTVRLWDLPTEEVTSCFIGHRDYVRQAAFLLAGSTIGGGAGGGLVVSGGYDGTVRLWDPRVPASSSAATGADDSDSHSPAVMTLTHPSAIDALLPMPGSTTILAASGPVVHVWDIIAAKPLLQLANHQKTVTSLAYTINKDLTADASTPTASSRRVITGGLDGHVKVYDTASWQVVHGIKYPAPILSLAISPEEKHLVVGMVNGLISIRTRTSGKEKEREREREKQMQAILTGAPLDGGKKKKTKAEERRLRGIKYTGDTDSVVLEEKQKIVHLRPYEKDLRAQRFAEALDKVLIGNAPALTTYTLLSTLKHRSALKAALANRDEATLSPVLKWLTKNLHRPAYVELIVDVALLVLDMYGHAIGQSPMVDGLLRDMRQKVNIEVKQSMTALRIGGMVGMLVQGAGGEGVRV
ncbi:WD40-repeat-containing domain protein [Tirmania nivea]|nr:WD40-repeat-containing domain protein [Tirmania nivea]